MLAVVTQNLYGKKLHYYLFPEISEEKWKVGAKTKYDIPQYINGIPDGFSFFCTTWEAGKIKKYQELCEKLENKIENALNNNNEEFETEPKPRTEHKYCHICNNKYEDYITHINSSDHHNNLIKQKKIFNRISSTYERVTRFWKIKRNLIIRIELDSEKDNISLISKDSEINRNNETTGTYYINNSNNKINDTAINENKTDNELSMNYSNKENLSEENSHKYRFVISLTPEEEKKYYNDEKNSEENEIKEKNDFDNISDEQSSSSKDICGINYLDINSEEEINNNSTIKEEIIKINSNSEESIKLLNSKKRMRSESSESDYKMTYKIYGIKPKKKFKFRPDD